MFNKNKLRLILKELDEECFELFQVLQSIYKQGLIKNWEYSKASLFKAYYQKIDAFTKESKIDTSDFLASEDIYNKRIATIKKRNSTRRMSHNILPIKSYDKWFYQFDDIKPYISLEDIRFSDGYRKANEEIQNKIEKRAYVMPNIHKDFSYIASLIEDTNTVDQMLAEKKTLKETLLGNPEAAKIISENPDIEGMVDAFSDNLDYTKKTLNNRNPNVGTNSTKASNEFAEGLTEDLDKVREEGHTSTRAIAKRFNELGIKTLRGGQWHHTSVVLILKRRKDLGLDSQEDDTPEPPSMD